MIQIPPLDELREVRRRLSEAYGNDPVRYAEMLREMSRNHPGPYITEPMWTGSTTEQQEPATK